MAVGGEAALDGQKSLFPAITSAGRFSFSCKEIGETTSALNVQFLTNRGVTPNSPAAPLTPAPPAAPAQRSPSPLAPLAPTPTAGLRSGLRGRSLSPDRLPDGNSG